MESDELEEVTDLIGFAPEDIAEWVSPPLAWRPLWRLKRKARNRKSDEDVNFVAAIRVN